MDRRTFSVTFFGAATAAVAGCGGGDSLPLPNPPPGDPPVVDVPPVIPSGPELAMPTSLVASRYFLQTIEATDGESSAAPGQANCWDLIDNFAIHDGNNDQFDDVVEVSVIVNGLTQQFPYDQVYSEFTAYGPELGDTDGVKSISFATDPAFVMSGTTTAVLHPVPNARFQQTLNFSNVVDGNELTLTWIGQDNSQDAYQTPYFFQVVIRDATSDVILATLYKREADGVSGNETSVGNWSSAVLTAFVGQIVVLCFEQRSSSCSLVDDVSVKDTNHGAEFVTNGNFEEGSTGWIVHAGKVSQNVTSGVRSVNGLDVQRSFFTVPNLLWARHTDVFFNPSTTPITAVISYRSALGSDNSGIIYASPDSSEKALTSWDGRTDDRDLGFVFGSADTVTYTSATALDSLSGDDNIYWTFDITVPPEGRVSLVIFTVLTGTDTGKTAVDITARATQVDTQNTDIANNFRTNFVYQRGMTQVQLDTLKNF
jgi:hypothetical protein